VRAGNRSSNCSEFHDFTYSAVLRHGNSVAFSERYNASTHKCFTVWASAVSFKSIVADKYE